MSERPCPCGQPLRDTLTFCDGCRDELEKALRSVPSVAADIEITMTRQRAAVTTGAPGSSASSLPFHERAGDARRELHNLLGTWARMCMEEGVGPKRDCPRNDPAHLAAWLLPCVPGLQQHDAGHDAVIEIQQAIAECSRIIFWKRRNRLYLGPCAYGASGDGECDGDTYAEEGASVGYCEACGAGLTVVIRQGELDADLASRLLTAAEIADWAKRMGVDANRNAIRKRVLYWHRHARITPASHDQRGGLRVPLFRYGDVRPLLADHYATAS